MLAALHALRRAAAPRWARGLVAPLVAEAGDPRFASVDETDLAFFRHTLGDAGVVTNAHTLAQLNTDWMGRYVGRSRLALQPASTKEVSAVLAHCFERRLAVTPQAGNTSLSGGSVPVRDEILFLTKQLDKVIEIDDDSGVVTCQAGVTLANLDAALAPHGLCVPLDLAAKARCQIGGNVSTNAGGLRLLRFGSLHGSVVGLEVVLPDGNVLDLLKAVRKDNTGLHLRSLFIGAEGTLGVVTAVSLLAPPRPAAVHTAFLALSSFGDVLSATRLARRKLGETLNAVEFFDAASLRNVLKHIPHTEDPFPSLDSSPAFYMVVETAGAVAAHDREKLDSFLAALKASRSEGDHSLPALLAGVVAGSPAHAAALWRLRESISESLVKAGPVYKYDLSLPTSRMYSLVEAVKKRVEAPGSDLRVLAYGHVGDGNLHLNVSSPHGYDRTVEAALEPFVFEQTRAVNGSVSAEHGIGQMKKAALRFSKSPGAVALHRRIKDLIDPRGIMNPGKMLPDE